MSNWPCEVARITPDELLVSGYQLAQIAGVCPLLIEILIRRYSDGEAIVKTTVDYDGITNAGMVAAYMGSTGVSLIRISKWNCHPCHCYN
jgi:hypothetical protein